MLTSGVHWHLQMGLKPHLLQSVPTDASLPGYSWTQSEGSK